MDDPRISRRHLIGGAAPGPLAVALAACGSDDDPSAAATTARVQPDGTLAATPRCHDGDEPTIEQTEGPYFLPDSPGRESLIESGVRGTRMVVSGLVLTTRCRPAKHALL